MTAVETSTAESRSLGNASLAGPLGGLPSDGGDDVVGVGTCRGEVAPALFILAIEVHGSGSARTG
jgi:hypothetical protein